MLMIETLGIHPASMLRSTGLRKLWSLWRNGQTLWESLLVSLFSLLGGDWRKTNTAIKGYALANQAKVVSTWITNCYWTPLCPHHGLLGRAFWFWSNLYFSTRKPSHYCPTNRWCLTRRYSFLVSNMYANNETGHHFLLRKLVTACQSPSCLPMSMPFR